MSDPVLFSHLPAWVKRLDFFLILLLLTVAIASVLPARGSAAEFMETVANVGIFALFFLYGSRLPTREALLAMRDWRLHGLTLAITFVVFPALGLLFSLLPASVIQPELGMGMLFLCLLPSTVQSSIALTSIAQGNVAAAICAASFSNLLGVLITPLLVAGLMHSNVGISSDSIVNIVLLLLAPFVLGQLTQRWVGPLVKRHPKLTKVVDRGSILLVVYNAFSHGMVDGIWSRTPILQLIVVALLCAILLGVALVISFWLARVCGFKRAEQIVILFCGSKKSMASGLPMANVLLPAASVSVMILPLMLFHQIQLLVCAIIARKLALAGPDHMAQNR